MNDLAALQQTLARQRQRERRRWHWLLLLTLVLCITLVLDIATGPSLLHEGTRVDITDKAMKGWRGIKVGDGREGWIETKAIEEI
jgi:hypothetical protein